MRRVARLMLVLVVFSIPWEYSLDLGAPFGNIARVLGLATALATVLAVLQTLEFRRLRALHWMTATLYLWFCLSFFWTSTPAATLAHLRWYPQEMMLVWLVWECTENQNDLWNLLWAWLAGSWVLVILTLANFVSSSAGSDQARFVAIGQDPNDVARYIDFGFPLAALLFDCTKGRIARVVALTYFPIGFACVLLTGSRGGLVIAQIALAGCGGAALIRHPRRIAASGTVAIVAAALIVAAIPKETIGRLNSVSELWQRGDLNQRVNIWSAGWRAFTEAPILGHGAGSFVAASALAPEDTAHNTPLAILVEGGVLALLPATAILLICCKAIGRSSGSLRIALGILMCAWCFSSLVGSVAENRITWLFFGIAVVSERVGSGDPNELGRLFKPGIRGCERAEV
jgi:O-antigen ligase